jgi:hypothetical protein
MSAVGDTGVLDGLAEIPWLDLAHAYGSAEDVPGLLRAIASGDAEAASNAVHELFGNIWHQGTVYAATEYAVPFLARMAAAGLASLSGNRWWCSRSASSQPDRAEQLPPSGPVLRLA